jgi:hypothetical protein
MQNKNKQKGFIQIIILLIIIAVVAYLMGFDPSKLWSSFIYPILAFIWTAILWVAQLFANIIKVGLEALNTLLNIFKK